MGRKEGKCEKAKDRQSTVTRDGNTGLGVRKGRVRERVQASQVVQFARLSGSARQLQSTSEEVTNFPSTTMEYSVLNCEELVSRKEGLT